jgi:acetyl esterase/lipase
MLFGCQSTMPTPPTTQSVQPPGPSQKVNLWPQTPPGPKWDAEEIVERGSAAKHDRHITHISNPRIEVFLPDHPDPNRPACVVVPGGGYGILAFDKEGWDVARMLNAHGVAAFVLIHRMPDGTPPTADSEPMPMQDVHRALRLVRASSAQWNINPKCLGIMGFSAGGHLASTAATQFDAGNANDADPIQRQSCRPDFAVLMYPVITLKDPLAHVGSRHNLLGKDASAESIDRYSSELHVTRNTPPLFIAHAEDDGGVLPQNSLLMAQAAAKAHVPCELVLFTKGGHGFGMGPPGSEVSAWPGRCIDWLRAMRIIQH